MDGMNNVAGDGGPPHDRNMEARIAVLEEIAAGTKGAVTDLRQEVHDLRADTNRRFDAMRDDMNRRFDAMRDDMNRRFDAMRDDMNRRFDTMRDAIERDFRLLFGAIITVALGLAALMARSFHWF
jgi:DNA anti-recombination protein RmuC